MRASAADTFYWPVRVYYEDTDALGMVYHANYLKYFERARVEWLRAAGIALQTLAQEARQAFVVRRLNVDYITAARLGEELEATVRAESVRSCSIELVQTLEAQAELYALAQVQIVYIDLDRTKPVVMPEQIRSKLSPSK